jgi:hypothetical protein
MRGGGGALDRCEGGGVPGPGGLCEGGGGWLRIVDGEGLEGGPDGGGMVGKKARRAIAGIVP